MYIQRMLSLRIHLPPDPSRAALVAHVAPQEPPLGPPPEHPHQSRGLTHHPVDPEATRHPRHPRRPPIHPLGPPGAPPSALHRAHTPHALPPSTRGRPLHPGPGHLLGGRLRTYRTDPGRCGPHMLPDVRRQQECAPPGRVQAPHTAAPGHRGGTLLRRAPGGEPRTAHLGGPRRRACDATRPKRSGQPPALSPCERYPHVRMPRGHLYPAARVRSRDFECAGRASPIARARRLMACSAPPVRPPAHAGGRGPVRGAPCRSRGSPRSMRRTGGCAQSHLGGGGRGGGHVSTGKQDS